MEIALGRLEGSLSSIVDKFVDGDKEPVIVTKYGTRVMLMIPYTEEDEIFANVNAGKTTYEDYRQVMLNKGILDLKAGKSKIRPMDVIASERVEDEKKRTNLMTADFALEAAKFFSMKSQPMLCPDCGHQTVPSLPSPSDVIDDTKKLLDEGQIIIENGRRVFKKDAERHQVPSHREPETIQTPPTE